MTIEEGFYNNTKFSWSLIPGTSGQMQVEICFNGTIEKFEKLSDKTFEDAFGFQVESGKEAPSHFIWHRSSENGLFSIYWNFMFSTMPCKMQKWQFVSHIFNGIDKVNDAVRKMK